ncbi:hypothetical protein EYB53_018335 [Candidatus Chloroploca sp. M-50]|uniref:Zinc-finger domain-containing protein n=1 Tax=Candidatus Chloroploca mongolica TaxID=2528176 RepID=A0ABS4DE04_9CHLR|nr:hypothetical protein [Candidatus Chloroploca mongolica]MBP1467679.1 hypothetical protein [Candidatus Chloroploca mongolica]
MSSSPCVEVHHWLAAYDEAPPPVALVAHVQDCARCQTALLTFLAERIGIPAPRDPSCATTEMDLPAMLDVERSEGAVAAARAFPDVWWHLWTCPLCAEVYHDTAVLMDATDAGVLTAPLPQAHQPTLRLSHTFLANVFAPQLAAGAAWNSATPELQLVAEEDVPEGRISLSVGAHDVDQWCLEVRVHPPHPGTVLVGLGEQVFVQALRDDQVALLTHLPLATLTDPDGPELAIALARAEGG